MQDLSALTIALLIVGVFVIALGRRHSLRTDSEELYKDLLRKCSGDDAQAERLIEGERKRYPNATRDSLIKRAIDRLETHRR